MPLKLFLATLLVVTCKTLAAQTALVEYPLDKNLLKFETPIRITFQGDDIIASVVHSGGAERFILHHDSMIHSFTQEKISNKADTGNRLNYVLKKDHENLALTYLNGYLQHDMLVECNYAMPQKTVYITETNTLNGTTHTTDTISFQSGETILNAFVDNNSLYVISSKEHSNQLNIYIKRTGQPLKGYEKTIVLDSEKRQGKKAKRFTDFFPRIADETFTVIDNRQSYPALVSYAPVKIYYQPGKIIFSIQHPDFETEIVQLRLSDLSHSITALRSPVSEGWNYGNPEVGYINTFLRDFVFIKTGVFNDFLYLNSININTGSVLSSTSVFTGNREDICKNAFFADGLADSIKNNPADRFWKIIRKHPVTVNCMPLNDSLVTVELVWYYNTVNAASAILSIVASAAGTYIINSIPHVMGYSFFIFAKQEQYTVSNTLNIRTGKTGDTGFKNKPGWEDKLRGLKEFIEQRTFNGEQPAMYVIGDTIYLSYINQKSSKYFLYKF